MSETEIRHRDRVLLVAELLVQDWGRVWIIVVSVLVLLGRDVRVSVGIGLLTVVLMHIIRTVLILWAGDLSIPPE